MRKTNFFTILAIIATFFTALTSTIPTSAVSCPTGSIRSSANTLAECNVKDNSDEMMPTVGIVINALIGIVGVIAIFVIIVSGIFFVTSQGDPAKTKKARDAMIFGIIGLVIAVLAFAIFNFVLSNIFPSDVAK